MQSPTATLNAECECVVSRAGRSINSTPHMFDSNSQPGGNQAMGLPQ